MITIVFVCPDNKPLEYLSSKIASNSEFQFKFDHKFITERKELEEYDILISPANSFGDLNGGIDRTYRNLLGGDLQERVRSYIRKYADGEILVGDYGVIPLDRPAYLILCPTMVIPGRLPLPTRNVYLFMRAVIKSLRKMKSVFYLNGMRVLCPIPGIGVGGLDYRLAVKQIKIAIDTMNGTGPIHAINMIKKEENTFGIPHFYAEERLQNIKLAYADMITI